jgi:hypothetical protein
LSEESDADCALEMRNGVKNKDLVVYRFTPLHIQNADFVGSYE